MTVPYNTGKVKIGHAYEPPKRRRMSRDEEELQRMLIGPGVDEPFRLRPDTVVYAVAAGVIIATALLLMGG